MWTSRISGSFGGVYNQCNDRQGSSEHPDLFKEHKSIQVWPSQHMFVEVYHDTNKEDFWGPQKDLLMLVRLEQATKSSLKSLDSTKPQSNRSLLLSPEVDTNKAHSESKAHNNPWDLKGTQGNL